MNCLFHFSYKQKDIIYWFSGNENSLNLVLFLVGVGYAAAVMAFWLNVYYIVVLAWALYYLYNSLSWDVPWRGCTNAWNSPKCKSEYDLAASERECFIKFGVTHQQCRANSSLFTSPVKEYWE